ncbi:MAG: DUF1800 family protein [Saprospiraceae bacterium]
MSSLTQRQGVLGKRLAAHLLRRTTYNITASRIANFATKTANQAVDELFVIPALQEHRGPIQYENGTFWLTDDPYVAPTSGTLATRSVLWWFYHELMNDTSIRHKMAIFFTGIYVSASDADWRVFNGYRLFQEYAIGNLKELAAKVSLDNRMLRYLNNNVNNKWNPNENYAREFLELFTILKGQQLGDGDYSNYTEHDIQEAAKVLTGYRNGTITDIDSDTGLAAGYADYNRHHVGNKQFSHHFNNQVIIGAVDETDMQREFQEFVDMIFGQIETAKAFVRRLYLFFVSDNITSNIETQIIQPLALQLLNDNYEVETTLKTLLKSNHFYDEDDSDNTDEIIGGKIKSPLELYFPTIMAFDGDNSGGANGNQSNMTTNANRLIFDNLAIMGFPEYAISVEGYPGFFKSPSFSKSWVDTSTLPMRYKMGAALLNGSTITNSYATMPFQIDIVTFVRDNFVNQEYADLLLTQLFELTLPEMPDADRREYFKDKLIGGITVINWMFEWQNYIATNNDAAVRVVLEDLFEALTSSPEYQTF